MVCKIFALSFSTILFFFIRSLYCNNNKHRGIDVAVRDFETSPHFQIIDLTLSSASFSMFIALLLTFLSSLVVVSSSFFRRWPASRGLFVLKSYEVLGWPKNWRSEWIQSCSSSIRDTWWTEGGEEEKAKKSHKKKKKSSIKLQMMNMYPCGRRQYVTREELCVPCRLHPGCLCDAY